MHTLPGATEMSRLGRELTQGQPQDNTTALDVTPRLTSTLTSEHTIATQPLIDTTTAEAQKSEQQSASTQGERPAAGTAEMSTD